MFAVIAMVYLCICLFIYFSQKKLRQFYWSLYLNIQCSNKKMSITGARKLFECEKVLTFVARFW